MRKKCSSDREKLLKFEAEGREFANFLKSLEQFIQTVKERSEQFLITECFFTCSRRFLISTLDSRINVGQEINIGPGKFAKKNKHRALNIHRAYKIWKKNTCRL